MTADGLVKVARVAKLVALFGFVLPWVLVSCNGQELASASGIDLIMGNIAAKNPMSGAVQHQHTAVNLWILLAAAATILGLLISFGLERVREQARAIALAAAAAIMLSGIGMYAATHPNTKSLQKSGDAFESDMNAGLAQMLKFEPRYGFWLTLAALFAAAAAGAIAASGTEGEVGSRPANARKSLFEGTES